ncbi:MAG: Asp-tRNA(Asn)/Glu-tRNA(Gln) amidotransferase subunit GatC [Pseudomonadota bacterium]
MKITTGELLHVARLARLSVDEKDVAEFTRQVGDILEYVDTLNQADTRAVPPTSHSLDRVNAFREDGARPSLGTDELLENAPDREGPDILVPKIIG